MLQAGFSARRIVFAFNRLTMLNIAGDRALFPIEIDGAGPVGDDDRAAVDQAVCAFVTDLSGHIGVRFDAQQVMPCDALRGWNTRDIAETAVGAFAPHRHWRTP